VETVIVEVADPPTFSVTLVGLNDMVGPLVAEGETVADRLTEPEKPLRLVMLTMTVPEDPNGTARVVVFADILKSGTTDTVTLIVVE
jgi:hypothetical protein